ncbi:MAG: hypothetical protein K6E30_03645 [Lachnospiraceae bacterium]|nr:hypothetical protein [Lachnospiraceae bacterium]
MKKEVTKGIQTVLLAVLLIVMTAFSAEKVYATFGFSVESGEEKAESGAEDSGSAAAGSEDSGNEVSEAAGESGTEVSGENSEGHEAEGESQGDRIVALDKSASADGAQVFISGRLPENTELRASSSEEIPSLDEQTPTLVGSASSEAGEAIKEGRFEILHAIDITLVSGGEEIQPENGPVDVYIRSLEIAGISSEKIAVYHIGEDGSWTEVSGVSVREDTVKFQADSFSTYVVGYTVDFHWGGNTFSYPGGTTFVLSELLRDLGMADINAKDIETVSFSDPSLIAVEKVYVLASNAAERNAEDGEPEETEEWILISLKPFHTDETLRITMKNGRAISMPVTDAQVEATQANGSRVTVEGVTYNLSNRGTEDGTCFVYALSSGSGYGKIYKEVGYNGHTYVVNNIDEGGASLRNNKTKMDWDLILKAAGYEIKLPEMRVTPTDEQLAGMGSYVSGEQNSGLYKVWKDASYDPLTNQITYRLKYFQGMKEKEPLDFIFIYDDSASMYSGTRTTHGVRMSEVQVTRVMLLDAVKTLLSGKEGYDIKVYFGGTSTGDSRRTETALISYQQAEEYLATYNTGVTKYAVGLGNALAMAQDSRIHNRIPIVVWLSDFHQALKGSSLRRTGDFATADQLHSLARVYALSTDHITGTTVSNVATSPNTIFGVRNTSESLDEGVKTLEEVIRDAIGYYISDSLTVADGLYETLSASAPADGSGDGALSTSAGSASWSLGNQNPRLTAGEMYSRTFTVDLDDETIYAGAMPTNSDVTVTNDGETVNTISTSPVLGSGTSFLLGRMKEKAVMEEDDAGVPINPVKGIQFKLTKEDKTTQIKPASADGNGYLTTDENGEFSISYLDKENNAVFELGKTYVLTERSESVAAYNNQVTGSDPKLIAPDKSWLIKVASNGVVTVEAEEAANQTPEATIAKAGNSKPPRFVLWNQIVEEAKLIPITVKKVWPANAPHKDPVPFTVYGVDQDTGVEYALEAYDGSKVESARKVKYIDEDNEKCTELIQADGTTVWTQEVYVTNKDGDDHEFFTYTEYVELNNLNPDHTYEIAGKKVTAAQLQPYADTDGKVYFGQTYSYLIKEKVDKDHLVYEDGWYVPSYNNNASKANKNTIEVTSLDESWTETTEAIDRWDTWSDTSTDFQLNFVIDEYEYRGSDQSDFINAFGHYDLETKDRISTFFSRISSMELEIKDQSNDKTFKLTVSPGAYSDTTDWKHGADFGVLFQGIKLPSDWEDYGTNENDLQQKIVNNLSIMSLVVVPTTDTTKSFTLYPKQGDTSWAYGPDSSNLENRLQIERLGGTHKKLSKSSYNNSNRKTTIVTNGDLTWHNVQEKSTVTRNSPHTINTCTLDISNTWNANPLIPVTVVKNWENADNRNTLPDISFSMTGTSDEKKTIKVYGSDASYDTANELYMLTSSNKGSGSTDTRWTRTYYVPQYDITTYNDNTHTCTPYSEYTLTENPLGSMLEGEAGVVVPGSWESVDEGILKENVTAPADWYEYTPESTSRRYCELTIRKCKSTEGLVQISGTKRIQVSYTYEGIQYRDTIFVKDNYSIQQANEFETKKINTFSFYNTSKETTKTYSVPFDLPGFIKDISEVSFTVSHAGDGAFRNMSDYLVDSHLILKSKQISNINTGDETVETIAPTTLHEVYRNETVSISGLTSTLTNKFIPDNALTLKSEFNDTTNDTASTQKIDAVIYTIKSGGEIVKTVNVNVQNMEAEKVVYLKDGTYTIEQTAYKVNGDEASYSFIPYVTKYKFNSAAETTGTSFVTAVNNSGKLTFTNTRKNLQVKVQTRFGPELEDLTRTEVSERPLGSDKSIEYTLSYYSVKNENMTTLPADGKYTLNNSDFVVGDKNYKDTPSDNIPTYSVNGKQTQCVITDDNLAAALPDYEGYIDSEETSSSLVFTIYEDIKRANIFVTKYWDGIADTDKKGVTLTYTLSRSDGKNITGYGSPSVDLQVSVPADFSGSSISGEFTLGTDPDDTTIDILVPVLRSYGSEGANENRVKYILTEKAEKGGTLITYYPVFVNESGFENAEFEQEDPAGDNGKNKAKFRLTQQGINISLTNASGPYICKIVEDFGGGYVENPFRRINDALYFARSEMNGSAVIEMLVNYGMPDTDTVTINAGENIVLTTAGKTTGLYRFAGSGDAAAISRGFTGASLCTVNGGNFSLSNIILDGEKSRYQCNENGGLVCISSGSLTVETGSILRNSKTPGNYYGSVRPTIGYGGAVFVGQGGSLTMNGGTIRDNEALHGGAIATAQDDNASGSTVIIKGSRSSRVVISDNVSELSGGGIYIENHSTLDMDYVDMSDCVAKKNWGGRGGGGAIMAAKDAKAVTIRNSSFTNCRLGAEASFVGGAIACMDLLDSNELKIESSSFDNSAVEGDSALMGGAIYSLEKLQANDLDITGFKASENGGALILWADAELENCHISNCSAAKMGGAIFAAQNTSVTLKNCCLENKKKDRTETGGNTAPNGSAVYLRGAVLDMEGGKIRNNTGAKDGALVLGVYTVETQDPNDSTKIVKSSTYSKVNFSGDAVVRGNNITGEEQKNVYLDMNDAAQINTVKSGLGSGADIGVWAKTLYLPTNQFGTVKNGASANLDRFVNDRNGLPAVLENTDEIHWKGCELTLTQTAESADGTFLLTVKSSAILKPSYSVVNTTTNAAVQNILIKEGSIAFSIQKGQTVKISGLAPGSYTVTEDNVGNMDVTAKAGSGGGALSNLNVTKNGSSAFTDEVQLTGASTIEMTTAPSATVYVPVVVRKVWDSYTPSNSDTVSFKVLGKAASGTIELPAYTDKNHTEAVNALTAANKQDDGSWEKTVYVPADTTSGNETIRFAEVATYGSGSGSRDVATYSPGYTIVETDVSGHPISGGSGQNGRSGFWVAEIKDDAARGAGTFPYEEEGEFWIESKPLTVGQNGNAVYKTLDMYFDSSVNLTGVTAFDIYFEYRDSNKKIVTTKIHTDWNLDTTLNQPHDINREFMLQDLRIPNDWLNDYWTVTTVVAYMGSASRTIFNIYNNQAVGVTSYDWWNGQYDDDNGWALRVNNDVAYTKTNKQNVTIEVPGEPVLQIANQLTVCKITDFAGSTLRVDGKPALYKTLEEAFEDFGSKTFSGTPAAIKMLVPEYSIKRAGTIQVPGGKPLTLTTAGSSDAEFPYTGTTSPAVIKRGSSTGSLFTVASDAASGTSFSTKDITLDGGAVFENGSYKSGAVTPADGGGIISASAGNVTIGDGTTMKNAAVEGKPGGAVYFKNDSGMLTVEGSRFLNCRSASSGGAIYTEGALVINGAYDQTTEAAGVQFVSCQASSCGGAICSKANITIQKTDEQTSKKKYGTLFSKCSSGKDGGAIATTVSRAVISLEACRFEESKAGGSGGAVVQGTEGSYTDNNKKAEALTVKNSTFYGTNADEDNAKYGGAIFSQSEKIQIENCDFRCLQTKEKGGALNLIYYSGGTTNISGCTFEQCKSPKQAGGAVYCRNKTLKVDQTSFTNNVSWFEGGGLYQDQDQGDGILELTDVEFDTCSSMSNSNYNIGGGVYSKTNITATGCTFMNCKATGSGGAVAMTSSNMTYTFTRCTMKDNTVENGPGGAIKAIGNTTLTDCSLIRNSAENGGGIYVESGTTTLIGVNDQVKIQNNTANKNGGGIYIKDRAVLVLSESPNISGNKANADGAGIYVEEGAKLKLQDSPYFGGAGINAEDGNVLTSSLSNQTNGKETYTNARQDIFLAGYGSSDAASLVVSGKISSSPGSIWVWAEKDRHYKPGNQFAVFESESVKNALGAVELAKTFAAFRNARTDADTGLVGSSYLTGCGGTNQNHLYWTSGKDQAVILRKVNEQHSSLKGARFRIFKADLEEITEGQPTYQEGDTLPEGKSVGDQKGYYESAETGVYFVGKLPEGRYYAVETAAPAGYEANSGKVFEITVAANGTVTQNVDIDNALKNSITAAAGL